MLCEDAVQIINSYTYTGNDSNKNELYSHYYDLLYDYLIKGGYYFTKENLCGHTVQELICLNKDELEHVKKVCRPDVFNYMKFSNRHIKTWFNHISSSTTGFLSIAKNEFAELFYDNKIIDAYFKEIIKIKIFREKLVLNRKGIIVNIGANDLHDK